MLWVEFQHTHSRCGFNTHTHIFQVQFQHTHTHTHPHSRYSFNAHISGTVSTRTFQVQFRHTHFTSISRTQSCHDASHTVSFKNEKTLPAVNFFSVSLGVTKIIEFVVLIPVGFFVNTHSISLLPSIKSTALNLQ